MLAELEESLRKRRAQHLWRERRVLDSAQGARVRIRDREYVSFASNDYLGLANRPELVEAACAGARRFGVGAGAAHLVVGHQEPHEALEQELAQFVAPCAGARAVTFSSGYLANLAILTTLAGRHDTIVADRLNHACLVDGALLARAKLVRYPHLDLRAAERALAAAPGRRVLATDAVFSMDGDLAPLPDLLALADACDAWLVVDDAHGFGVLGEGRGSLAHFGIASERIVYMGTLGKAAGVAGAFVAAHPAVFESIVQTARPYIYTTAAPALLAHALRGALTLVRDGARERAHLASLVAAFREAARELPWSLLPSATPIQPLVVGDAATTVRISRALEREGLLVPAIRPPTVPAGTSRLRVSLSAAHAHDDVRALTRALGRVAADA
jgi:8-amino-7-oxononanoate synthase